MAWAWWLQRSRQTCLEHRAINPPVHCAVVTSSWRRDGQWCRFLMEPELCIFHPLVPCRHLLYIWGDFARALQGNAWMSCSVWQGKPNGSEWLGTTALWSNFNLWGIVVVLQLSLICAPLTTASSSLPLRVPLYSPRWRRVDYVRVLWISTGRYVKEWTHLLRTGPCRAGTTGRA